MKKLIFAALIVASFTSCKKDKLETPAPVCGVVIASSASACGPTNCTITTTVKFPDNSIEKFIKNGTMIDSYGSPYCK